MTSKEKFMLYVYDGDYGLPSINSECIKALLYCSIIEVPVQIRTLNNIKFCTFYSGPCFVHKNLSFKSSNDIVLYLNTLNYNLNVNLNPKQKSECLALTHLVQAKLRSVLEFQLWIDQRNLEEFTRIWYGRALPWPFNSILVKRFKENAINLIESLYPSDYNTEVIREDLQTMVTDCLSSLSTRLGTSNYFFGDKPSTLDIVVYSYVAPLIKLPLPANSFNGCVTLWPNLVRLIKRIDAKYLPGLPKESKYIKIRETTNTSDEEVSYVAISIFTLSAVTLVFGFAITRGIISSRYF
ncbi:hypothetical protein ABEB36_014842 [Hypothenemus hampei]|uniref:Uncharacterized protein n=1 Tax=Hypothenemus hampei TaxID=57062 RepID=A0ABD1E206_HYPHA